MFWAPSPQRLNSACSATISQRNHRSPAAHCSASGPVPFVIAGEALDLLADGNALVEFEGEDFAWVKYADPTDAEQPGSDAQDASPSESGGQAPERR